MQRLHTLPNGFRIVTEAMPGLQSASIGLWVEAGGRHETPDQNGIAHFLEHMAFKGTRRRSALRIAEEIEDVGGYINAYTSREMTAYYARVLSQDPTSPSAARSWGRKSGWPRSARRISRGSPAPITAPTR